MSTPPTLARPSALSLSRASDRLSFLYLDRCRVEQDDNGTHASIVRENGARSTTYLPTATLTTLLLGPGTSITQPAVAALSRTACAVAFVGSGAVRSYGAFLSPYAPTTLLEAQAVISSSEERRIEVAREMYLKRFHEAARNSFPAYTTMEFLRGLEGARVKAHYGLLAKKHRLGRWRRNQGNLGPLDPVNEALNYANTALYGVVNSVVLALGMSPGLGIVHRGNRQAFVLDIADLYKAEVTVPLAFSLCHSDNAGRDVMRKLREDFRLLRLLPRIVDDIHELMGFAGEGHDPDDWDVDALYLWAPGGSVTAGVNYGSGGGAE